MMTNEQVTATLDFADNALVQIGGLVGFDFYKKRSGKFYILKDGTKYGLIEGRINRHNGNVLVKFVPDKNYKNYCGISTFQYSAIDGTDDTMEFVAWITDIKGCLPI